MADPLDLILGPGGALAATAAAAGVLWRRHIRDDDDRAAARDSNLAFERSRTRHAEDRLDELGTTLKEAARVMEKAVDLAESVVEDRTRHGR